MALSLSVWLQGDHTGLLEAGTRGSMRFVYDPTWVAAVRKPSVFHALPKRPEPYVGEIVRQAFGGLLPSGAQRRAAAQTFGGAKVHDFRLLESFGGDVAGALSLWPMGESPPLPGLAAATPLTDKSLAALLDGLAAGSLDRDWLRALLPGSQPKLPVVLVGGRIALPAPGQPTTHIVKVARTGIEPEAFAMRLAAAVGLAAPQFEIGRLHARRFLLVTRYDRQILPTGVMGRLPQESFRQAIGTTATLNEAFNLVRRACATPAPSLVRLLDAILFKRLIGHAGDDTEGLSLVFGLGGAALAPLSGLSVKGCEMAYCAPLSCLALAAEIGMPAPYVRRRLGQLSRAVTQAGPSVADALIIEGGSGEVLHAVCKNVLDYARHNTAVA